MVAIPTHMQKAPTVPPTIPATCLLDKSFDERVCIDIGLRVGEIVGLTFGAQMKCYSFLAIKNNIK